MNVSLPPWVYIDNGRLELTDYDKTNMMCLKGTLGYKVARLTKNERELLAHLITHRVYDFCTAISCVYAIRKRHVSSDYFAYTRTR